MEKNKLKLLHILDILKETDENCPITANRIVTRLHANGIDAERKSVLRDIAALIDYGYDIVLHSDNKLGYYLASRDFEDWELKFLCDAVSSARFLSSADREELIERICGLSSRSGEKILRSENAANPHYNNDYPNVKYSIDRIFTAISEKKIITFRYVFTDSDLKKKMKRGALLYSVSPYSLYFRSGNYYLIGCTDGHDNLCRYRLDRMREVEISEQNARPAEEILGANPKEKIGEYIRDTLYNFSGKKITLKLIAEPFALDDVIDFFGDNLRVAKADDKLLVTVRTTESEGLIRWLMQYSFEVTAAAPQSVTFAVSERLTQAAENYRTTSSMAK